MTHGRSPLTTLLGRRYELSFFIGPCTEAERDALMETILDLPEFVQVGGGGVGAREASDDE